MARRSKKNPSGTPAPAPSPSPAPAKKNPARKRRAVVATSVPTPRKRRRSLAASRRKSVARKNPSSGGYLSNPPLWADIKDVLIPGFLTYAGTRLVQRMIYTLVQKRWPNLGKHAHAVAGVGTFAAGWFFAHKIDAVAKYHDGIVMGSGIAAAHGIAEAYLPAKYSWILGACKPDDVAPADTTGTGTLAAGAQTPLIAAPAATSGDEFSYLEEDVVEEPIRPKKRRRSPAAVSGSGPVASAMKIAATGNSDDITLDPDLAELETTGENVDDLMTGVFGSGN
jgi:hypothetical protein